MKQFPHLKLPVVQPEASPSRGFHAGPPERTQQGYQAFPSSDGVHSTPSDTALRFRDSSFCSQDPRRGANSFVRGGLVGAGTSTRTSRRASNPPPIPPRATPGSRDSSHRYQDARCAISTSFRRGGAGESTPTRSQQGYHATFAGGGNQSEAMTPHLRPSGAAPTFRHSKATPQDARLAAEALSEWNPCGAKQLLAVIRSVGRRSAVAELMAE